MKTSITKLAAIACLSSTLMTNALSAGVQPTGTQSNSTTQATATLSAVCTLQAQNLSFGNVVMPLTSQGASSNMSVLCSKSSAYTISLAYGGQYGAGTQTVQGTVTSWSAANTGSTIICGYQYTDSQGNRNNQFLDFAGATTGLPSECPSQSFTIGATYTYGKMVGIMSGDAIGYSIQVPGNPGQVWNTGQGSYAGTGTGSSQSIPIVGKLVPAQSSTNYPTPDSYMDTVTALVNF